MFLYKQIYWYTVYFPRKIPHKYTTLSYKYVHSTLGYAEKVEIWMKLPPLSGLLRLNVERRVHERLQ